MLEIPAALTSIIVAVVQILSSFASLIIGGGFGVILWERYSSRVRTHCVTSIEDKYFWPFVQFVDNEFANRPGSEDEETMRDYLERPERRFDNIIIIALEKNYIVGALYVSYYFDTERIYWDRIVTKGDSLAALERVTPRLLNRLKAELGHIVCSYSDPANSVRSLFLRLCRGKRKVHEVVAELDLETVRDGRLISYENARYFSLLATALGHIAYIVDGIDYEIPVQYQEMLAGNRTCGKALLFYIPLDRVTEIRSITTEKAIDIVNFMLLVCSSDLYGKDDYRCQPYLEFLRQLADDHRHKIERMKEISVLPAKRLLRPRRGRPGDDPPLLVR